MAISRENAESKATTGIEPVEESARRAESKVMAFAGDSAPVTGSCSFSFPPRIGLCPVHGEEFYMPLEYGDSLTCPECLEQMVVYERPAWEGEG